MLLLALVVAALAGSFSWDVTTRMSNETTISEDAARPGVTARHAISEATGADPSQGYVIEVRTERALTAQDPAPPPSRRRARCCASAPRPWPCPTTPRAAPV
ncbi:hypothetical protein [Streptomyces sulphureus]|uniref:hypothetical protein n=1 Tax=Streptomyces sulphureus TaxID=47758 RepID=UPI0003809748|nr:hypothetical protein [Streptomyces sulphureus]